MPDGAESTSAAGRIDITAPADGGQVSPMLATAAMESPSDGGGMPTAVTNPLDGPQGSISINEMGWVNSASLAANESSPDSAPRAGPDWPVMADVRRMEMTGTLDPDQTSMTFAIPVGPLTEALGLSLKETGGVASEMPEFGQLDLVNPAGTTIEQVGPLSGPGASGPQAMTVQLRNATNGSRILVQITAAEPWSALQRLVRDRIGNHGCPESGLELQYFVRSGRSAARSGERVPGCWFIGAGPGIRSGRCSSCRHHKADHRSRSPP